jgi:hypothetical protein
MAPGAAAKRQEVSDEPLNYSDRVRNINPQLRQLDLQWLLETAKENIGVISSALLLGGAVGFLFKRRYIIASNLVLASILQQVVLKQLRIGKQKRINGKTPKEEIELERFALKAERGDYGKIDFIAFK